MTSEAHLASVHKVVPEDYCGTDQVGSQSWGLCSFAAEWPCGSAEGVSMTYHSGPYSVVRNQHCDQYCDGEPLGVSMDSLVPLCDDSAVLESAAITTAGGSVACVVQLQHQHRQGFCVDWEQTSCGN